MRLKLIKRTTSVTGRGPETINSIRTLFSPHTSQMNIALTISTPSKNRH